jgi:hypothetical protein
MNEIEKAKTGIEIVGNVIRMAGDDPNVKQSASELSKTALTLTKAINNALLPLAALNFAVEKAKIYFTERFEKDLKQKADKISTNNLIEPKASIAGPALQGLSFAHEEPLLRDLFLELLAGSMDKEREHFVHPAFVEILKQIESEEARLIKSILAINILPIAAITRMHKNNGSMIVVKRHILNITNQNTNMPAQILNLPAMIDNWVRLGLVTVDYDKKITDTKHYDWLVHRPEISEVPLESADSEFKIEWQMGIIFPTEFGIQFAKAIGIINK